MSAPTVTAWHSAGRDRPPRPIEYERAAWQHPPADDLTYTAWIDLAGAYRLTAQRIPTVARIVLRARDAARIVRPCHGCGRATADMALVNPAGEGDTAALVWRPYCADAPAASC